MIEQTKQKQNSASNWHDTVLRKQSFSVLWYSPLRLVAELLAKTVLSIQRITSPTCLYTVLKKSHRLLQSPPILTLPSLVPPLQPLQVVNRPLPLPLRLYALIGDTGPPSPSLLSNLRPQLLSLSFPGNPRVQQTS